MIRSGRGVKDDWIPVPTTRKAVAPRADTQDCTGILPRQTAVIRGGRIGTLQTRCVDGLARRTPALVLSNNRACAALAPTLAEERAMMLAQVPIARLVRP